MGKAILLRWAVAAAVVVGGAKRLLGQIKNKALGPVILLSILLVFYVVNWGTPLDFEVMLRYGKSVRGIMVTTILIVNCEEKYNINYCKLLKKATANNANAIRQLTLLKFSGCETSYDHGAVIVGLIKRLGEDKFINSLGEISVQQRHSLESDIMAGMEYGGYSQLKDKTIKDAFPKIYTFLNSKAED